MVVQLETTGNGIVNLEIDLAGLHVPRCRGLHPVIRHRAPAALREGRSGSRSRAMGAGGRPGAATLDSPRCTDPDACRGGTSTMPALITPTARRALLAAPALLLGAAAPRIGEAVEVAGEARAGEEGRWRGLSPAAALLQGDTLATGPASRLRARLAGGMDLRLGEAARLRLDQVAPAGTTLRLGAGALFLAREGVARAPAAVVSPAALIAVRGTRLWCGPEEGRFAVLLLHGAAEVIAGGIAVPLAEGEGTDLGPGEAPTPARRWGAPRIARALGMVGVTP
jgi:hypothetical protein